MQVTDEMVEAGAKKLYEMRHLTRWEALGERSQDIYRVEARAMLRTAATLVDVPVIPTANCCVCGRIIDTREKSEGGDDFGDETEAGKWTCSVQCYDAYVGFAPDVPAEPVAFASEYGLKTLAEKAHHYCLSLNKSPENEFTIPVYASPPLSRQGEDSEEVDRMKKELVSAYGEFNRIVCEGVTETRSAADALDRCHLFANRGAIAIRTALAATRNGSATTATGGDDACPGEHQEVLDAIQFHNSGEDE